MMSVVCKAFAQISETGRLRLFRSHRPEYPDGGQMRDFVYVKDCVDVMWALVEKPEVCGVFNLGSGKARTWNDLAAAVFAAMDRPANVEYIDIPAQLRGAYQYFTESGMVRLRAAGIEPPATSLEDAVADYVQHYLSQDAPHLGNGTD